MKPASERAATGFASGPRSGETRPDGDAVSVAVLVLGDLGRSPRLQFHALSLAEAGAAVELVGYAEHELYPEVANHPRVRVTRLPSPRNPGPASGRGFAYLARTMFRLARQAVALRRVFRLPRCATMIVQTPPALPALPLVWLACRLRGMRFAVDWHNLGYTMLGLRLGQDHPAVRFARLAEGLAGARADVHFCVSETLRARLRDDFGIKEARVLYDKPPAFLPRPKESESDRASFFSRAFGKRIEIEPADRVLVSPTSWSLDEAMELILEAARQYRDRMNAAVSLPKLRIFVTGQGPRRGAFEAALAASELAPLEIHTGWLEPGDYVAMLAHADLGVCLHTSSSKADLPMKLADMAGAGLPACAFDYGPCLRERFIAGTHGELFSDATGLAGLWAELFADGGQSLESLRANLAAAPVECWEGHWNTVAGPVLLAAQEQPSRSA